ncbi:hypothetical protein F5B22DRAFT_649248 [Xylaria bambusicola]|uniref:uncharacterized protein n=1 Tax=Xylaria bambusicola TaxID=326684 RepID=UPI0020077940|nr:uncharacterized protein F5B22DRAFT_649248 [Xylaria bambusicola]KAI0509200.1 hypothetical protein F5B22DRAFT_649248 [Xylaria bambusicola]
MSFYIHYFPTQNMPSFTWKKTSKHENTMAAEGIPSYKELLQDEAESNREDPDQDPTTLLARPKVSNYFIIGNVLLLLVSLGLFLGSFFFFKYGLRQSENSPALDTMMPQWGPQLNKQLPLDANGSITRQNPSEEVNQYWSHVTDVGMLEISRAQLLKLGKSPDNSVRTPASWLDGAEDSFDEGDERYIAIIDGIHLLHCFNAMRKSLFHNYPIYFPDGYPASYGAHLSHCQETLAHWLMCQPSLEFITFGWYEKREPPFPDFDVTRKCVDFGQILDWQDEHRIKNLTKPMFDALRPDPSMPRRKAPIMYDEILGNTWDEYFDMTEDLAKHLYD